MKSALKQHKDNIMKKREIRIPPLPQTKALSEESESAFFVSGAKAAPKKAPSLKSSRKRFMRTRQFKNARIVRAANGDWRVVYEYQLPGQTGKFRKFYVRDGINYIHDPEEKELAAQRLREDRAEKNKYYSPVVAEKVKSELINDPEIYNYSKWIFYSCMRPKEIRHLKV